MSPPVSRVLSWTVIHLGQASPPGSSDLPKSDASHIKGLLFGLAPSGVYHRHDLLPGMRCALTAPFQPYRQPRLLRRYTFCCTFRGFAPPRDYLALCSVEPGLSSCQSKRLSSGLGRNNSAKFSWIQALLFANSGQGIGTERARLGDITTTNG